MSQRRSSFGAAMLEAQLLPAAPRQQRLGGRSHRVHDPLMTMGSTLHRVYLVARAGIAVGALAWVGAGLGLANGSATSIRASSGQGSATAILYLAAASLSLGSPSPRDFSGNPLVPGGNQRSVSYLLSHDGYSASLSVRRSGTLEVIWTALGATGPITLATGKVTYRTEGDQRFQLRLTRNGRAALTRGTKLTFRISGWYGRTTKDRDWLCLCEATERSTHKLVFSNACGP
jgi:hypothetical protein